MEVACGLINGGRQADSGIECVELFDTRRFDSPFQYWFVICLTFKVSHAYAWRESCPREARKKHDS
jgi:hypothetical protein